MKRMMLMLVSVISSMQVSAVNVTIIESLTGNSWAVQDTVWRYNAEAMGYTATIAPQSTLDDLSNLSGTDVLIVASGTLTFLLPEHLQTIIDYVLSGRSAYIQSEYQTTFQGNITFQAVMDAVGAAFQWSGPASGSLVPMNIVGELSTTPNAVTQIDYFNYGYAGTGSGVDGFLEFSGSYFGFCYVDEMGVNGTVISISDEDWLWQDYSPALVQNMLYKLANSLPNSIYPIVDSDPMISIYPNPFYDVAVIFSAREMHDVTIKMLDEQGRQLKEISHVNGMNYNLKRDDLATGVYYIQVMQGRELLVTKKVLVANK